ncbi:MAG: hypothetical protein ACXWKR_13880 [Phenylobacterium sp.]
MSAHCSGGADSRALRRIAPDAADRLRLAATPAFAMMAIVTGMDAHPDMICATAHASPLSGMAPMYLLMSAVHAGPWLKRLFRRP